MMILVYLALYAASLSVLSDNKVIFQKEVQTERRELKIVSKVSKPLFPSSTFLSC